MKATKKIVGAACALVAAVALSAGSTFAWFSQSGTVTATGMKVQATTSKDILISNSNDASATWDTTAATTDTASKTLTPASTTNGKDFFYVANPETINYSDGKSAVGTEFKATTDGVAGATYVASYTYYIKAAGADGTEYSKLYVSNIEVKTGDPAADSSANISKALRVSVTYGTGTTYIYAPVTGYSQNDGKGVAKLGTVSATDDCRGAVTITTGYADTANLGTVTKTATAAVINVWYEGDDAACTSANAVSVEALTVAVAFSAAE